MRFGLFGGAKSAGTGPDADSHGYKQFIDYVLKAEELGLHGLFMVEHHFTGAGQVSASLNLLSFLAARTSRLRLGTAVIVLPWHNPALLAEQIATVDLLSSGRFDCGVGKGYRASEFAGFCIPQGEATERFDETISFLRRAWSEPGRFSHHGKYWKFENVVIEPRCVQQPHPPLWMAAGSFESIRRAAREGFNLLLDQIGPTALSLERAAVYRDELERCGRGRTGGQVALARALQLAQSAEELREARAVRKRVLERIGDLARGPGAERYHAAQSLTDADLEQDDAVLMGAPEDITARLQVLANGDIDTILLIDPTGSTSALEVFAREIAPQVTAEVRTAAQ